MAIRSLVLTLILSLAACQSLRQTVDDGNKEAPVDSTEKRYALDRKDAAARLELSVNGLMIGDNTQIHFGVHQHEVLAKLARLRMPVIRLFSPADCHLLLADVGNGMALKFNERKFVGWSLGTPSKLKIESALGIGSARDEVLDFGAIEHPFPTIPEAFAVNGIFGTFDGTGENAKVRVIWAGEACIFQ